MSKIDELINKHCPDGVEFKALDDLFEIRNGYTPSKAVTSNWTDGIIPWFRMEDIRKNGHILDDAIQHVPERAIKGGRIFPANSIIISTSATIGEHALIRAPFISNQRFTTLWLKSNYTSLLDMKFIFYYCYVLDEWCKRNVTTSSFASVDMAGFKRFKFPMPPLEVQNEIVNTLDAFTSLEFMLEAELESRRKQYEYYRNKLLSFDASDTVQWKTLSEVGILIRGNGLQKKDFTEEGVGAVHYGQIYTYYGTFADKTKSFVSSELAKKLKKAEKGDVLIAGVSENLQDVCKPLGWLGGRVCISGDMFAFRHNQNTKYITYLLQTDDFQRYKERNAQGTKVIRVKADKILQYKIPIPSIDEQNRIASILDKFEGLVNSIAEGLPAEITARRIQYEHYRNKLLTFTELPA